MRTFPNYHDVVLKPKGGLGFRDQNTVTSRSFRTTCAGPCGKVHRFSRAYAQRVEEREELLCRPCYHLQFGEPRPIPGREKKQRINVKRQKSVQQPKKEGKKSKQDR